MPQLSHKKGRGGRALWMVAFSVSILNTLPLAKVMAATPYDPTADTSQPSASASSSNSSSNNSSSNSSAALSPGSSSSSNSNSQPVIAPLAVPNLGPAPAGVTPVPVPAQTRKGKRIFPAPLGAPLTTGLDNTTLKTGTDATTLQTGTNNTTLQVGTQSTTLTTGTDSSLLRTGVERKVEPVNILFIVDASRSMLEKLEPQIQKIDAAKQVLQQALSRIPPDVNLGLRVFGQGYNGAGSNNSLFSGLGGLDIAGECRNTALWVPIGKGNRRAIIERVRELKPYGMTPLAYAIAQAAFSDFRNCQGNKVIILITDGADTCNGDPCTVIKQLLPKYGIKIKVDVVGLSLHREPQARDQLNCVAEKSGGKYFDAKTAADLIDSVSASVQKAIEGRVIIKPSAPAPDAVNGGAPAVNPINTKTPEQMVPFLPEQLKDLPH